MENTYSEKNTTVEEYNEEPIFYCSRCLSIKILNLAPGIDYCDECGSTEINSTDIYTWRKMYKEKYGKEF